jgi:hypothetical protein
MQFYGNVGKILGKTISKSSGRVFYEYRIAESQAGTESPSTCWYTVRVMSDKDPCLKLGDFVRVTGILKVDYYLSKQGEPTGTLLVIAFEATKKTKSLNSEDPALEPPTPTPTPMKSVPKPQVVQDAPAHAWSD